jgi:hypothetical protein
VTGSEAAAAGAAPAPPPPGPAAGPGGAPMLVLNRFQVPAEDADAFGAPAAAALAALRRQPGFLRGQVGRAADDPRLWTIVTEWAGAGFWRRALSAFDVRVELTPLTVHALDEPGAFEALLTVAGPGPTPDPAAPVGGMGRGSDRAPDAAQAGPGGRPR